MALIPRIAAVSYLNTIPFIYGIRHAGNLRAELLLTPPALCASNFIDGNATDDTKSAWNIDRLTSDMRCSKVMGDQLAQLIKYCRLSGIDYKAVLDEYYTNGLLPCESKREGKKCLFELKQRLL